PEGGGRGGAGPPDTNTVGPGQSLANPVTPQQLDYAYRVVFSSKSRREGQWAYIYDDNRANLPTGLGGVFPAKKGMTFQTVEVQLGVMRPVWLPAADQPEWLFMVRGARVGGKPVYQGFAID